MRIFSFRGEYPKGRVQVLPLLADAFGKTVRSPYGTKRPVDDIFVRNIILLPYWASIIITYFSSDIQ